MTYPQQYPTQQPYPTPQPAPGDDPFANPATIPNTFPTQASFRGRLIMITPRKVETVANHNEPGKFQERVTADVSVVDGLGPVPQMKQNAHTGQFLQGPEFPGVWFNGTRVIEQLRPFIGTGQAVLGVFETYKPGQQPIKGNPWGIVTATEEQKNTARNYLATRTVGAAAAPAPVVSQAPQYPGAPMQATTQPAPVYGHPGAAQAPQYPFAQQAPAYAPQTQAPGRPPAPYPQPVAMSPAPAAPGPAPAPIAATAGAAPVPGPATPGVNPFAPQAPAPGVNPFAPQQ